MSLNPVRLNGSNKRICTISRTGHPSWCLYDKGDDTVLPCATCVMRDFYVGKQRMFIYAQWKGWMVADHEQWIEKYPNIKVYRLD